MNKQALRPAYQFLRHAAFHDIPLPARINLSLRKLRDAYGYFYSDPSRIEIDSGISDPITFLKVMAHEMCHASLERGAVSDHHHHDENFNQLAKIVCERMRWTTRGF